VTQTPISVTQLTARIKQMLEQNFVGIAVSGEVSRLTRPASSHLYFTIKDSHAAISAVVWRSAAARLGTVPKEGGEYIFTGHLSVYEPRGSYQLVVTRIEAAGAGKLAAEFERRKQLFGERGWFDPEKKQSIPRLPHHIGIATSATAAAFEDVKKIMATRPAWLKLSLSPCLVQGAAAPASIAAALERLQQLPDKPDTILLVRGGGSIEDLWCFNDEAVVRAIVQCSIPLITGIGHEIDFTLSDFAADSRAATPSNAAELSCPSRQELHRQIPRTEALASIVRQKLAENRHRWGALSHRQTQAWHRQMDSRHHRIQQAESRLLHRHQQHIHSQRHQLHSWQKRLQAMAPANQLHLRRHRLRQADNQLQQAVHSLLAARTRSTRQQQQGLQLATAAQLPPRRARLMPQAFNFQRLLSTFIATRRQQLALSASRLNPYDKQDILARGFSLNYDHQNKLVTRAAALQPGDKLRLEFIDGAAAAHIESTERKPA